LKILFGPSERSARQSVMVIDIELRETPFSQDTGPPENDTDHFSLSPSGGHWTEQVPR